MFKRREKQKISENIRNFVWPKIGWGRWMQYYSHRVGRLSDSPYRIAVGLACGVAVSFTPFFGFHVVLAIIVSFIIRGNLFAAAIGTIVGNPLTFSLILPLTYNVGAAFSGVEDTRHFSELIDAHKLITHPFEALEPVFYTLITGGVIVGVLVGWLCYYVFLRLIVAYRKKRATRLDRHKKRFGEKTRLKAEISDDQRDKNHD